MLTSIAAASSLRSGSRRRVAEVRALHDRADSRPARRATRGMNSGQIVVTVKSVTGGKSYFIRYAVMNGTTPGPWTTIPAASIQKAIRISGLTPQTLYGFQVQAHGVLGYSDWSTTETIGCV